MIKEFDIFSNCEDFRSDFDDDNLFESEKNVVSVFSDNCKEEEKGSSKRFIFLEEDNSLPSEDDSDGKYDEDLQDIIDKFFAYDRSTFNLVKRTFDDGNFFVVVKSYISRYQRFDKERHLLETDVPDDCIVNLRNLLNAVSLFFIYYDKKQQKKKMACAVAPCEPNDNDDQFFTDVELEAVFCEIDTGLRLNLNMVDNLSGYEGCSVVGVKCMWNDENKKSALSSIQFSNSSGRTTIVDLYFFEDKDVIKKICDILTNGSIVKVFHDCRLDCKILYEHYGIIVAPVFDNQIAYMLYQKTCGNNGSGMVLPYPVGLGASILREFPTLQKNKNFRIGRTRKTIHWKKRPFSQEAVNYMRQFVFFLPHLYWRYMYKTKLNTFKNIIEQSGCYSRLHLKDEFCLINLGRRYGFDDVDVFLERFEKNPRQFKLAYKKKDDQNFFFDSEDNLFVADKGDILGNDYFMKSGSERRRKNKYKAKMKRKF